MIANSHQTARSEVSRNLRSFRFESMAGWLIAGLVVVNLLAVSIWSQNSIRYPGAERQAAAPFPLRCSPQGALASRALTKLLTTCPKCWVGMPSILG
jgi:hypothetical protein